MKEMTLTQIKKQVEYDAGLKLWHRLVSKAYHKGIVVTEEIDQRLRFHAFDGLPPMYGNPGFIKGYDYKRLNEKINIRATGNKWN